MPSTAANGIELYYDTFGGADQPTVLLVSGLGAQCVAFDDEFCRALVAGGVHVVRYDNRDVGLSTHLDESTANPLAALASIAAGEPLDAPYDLSDMAADGMALLDVLGIDAAHVVGTSMGGMIAQTMAIEYPDRVRSLTTVMSTTGDADVGQPDPATLGAILGVIEPKESRDERIAGAVLMARAIGTAAVFDADRARRRAEIFVDRSYDPAGTGRQLVAILASGSRAKGLAEVSVPTLVMHGDADPLVDISGGRRTAELVPGAEFLVLEGMAHDLPPEYWDRVIGGIFDTVRRGTA